MRILLLSIFVIFLVVLLTPNAFAVTYPVLILNGVADNKGMNFSPSEIEIDKGDTIIWKNLELNTVHTVTFASLGIDRELVQWQCTEIGECSSIQKATFSYTFEELGTHNYKCKIHSWMNGVVKVTEFGSEAEVSADGDGGVMFIDKSQYTVTETERANITIYGKVNEPGSGNKPLFVITNPDGSIEEQSGVMKHDGEYFLDLYVTYEETGTYNVHATFGLEDIGTAKFDVVKRPNPTIENPFPPSDDESTNVIGLPPLTVTTDSQSYDKGDMIKISGTAPVSFKDLNQGQTKQVIIQLFDPRNNLVTVNQIWPKDDRTYFTSINSNGPLWNLDGAYVAKTSYANEMVFTKFFVTIPNTPAYDDPAPPTQSKISTVLTLNPLPSFVKLGETLTFSGSLMTTDGMPVADKKISFWNTGDESEFGWLDTRQDGTFAGTLKMNQADIFIVFAFFYGGSSNFETAQSTTTIFEVSATGSPPTQPDDNPYAGIAGLLIAVVVIAGIGIGIRGARKKKQTQHQTTGGSGQQQVQQQVYPQALPKKKRNIGIRKPKPQIQPQGIEDYDLGPLLYCPNVACRSEHLQTKANGQKYCTKCGWNK